MKYEHVKDAAQNAAEGMLLRATGRGAGLGLRGPGGARPHRHATTAAAAAVFVQLALRRGRNWAAQCHLARAVGKRFWGCRTKRPYVLASTQQPPPPALLKGELIRNGGSGGWVLARAAQNKHSNATKTSSENFTSSENCMSPLSSQALRPPHRNSRVMGRLTSGWVVGHRPLPFAGPLSCASAQRARVPTLRPVHSEPAPPRSCCLCLLCWWWR